MNEDKTVAIVGAGVVGAATGKGLASLGCRVIFSDTDDKKLAYLRSEGYAVESKAENAAAISQAIFVCVPTPTVIGQQDISFLSAAVHDVAMGLQRNRNFPIVVIRSTVLPGTTRKSVIPLIEQVSGLKRDEDFGVCVNPEFLREASPLPDFLTPSRIVLGELDKQSGDHMEPILNRAASPLFRTDLETAEFVKYVANSFLATKISFFNEMFLIAEQLHVDSKLVAEATRLDPRIGPYGTMGGWAFSGKCLPKDSEAFAAFAHDLGKDLSILQAALDVNTQMKGYKSEEAPLPQEAAERNDDSR